YHNGRIEQIGTPEQLYGAPESLFTARFLGDSNVFELEVAPDGVTATWHGEHWKVDPATIAAHAGVRQRGAVVVRPESISIARTDADVPTGANSVRARVTDIQYLGSSRTVLLAIGPAQLPGRAKVDPDAAVAAIGDDVVVWWRPERQRVVAA